MRQLNSFLAQGVGSLSCGLPKEFEIFDDMEGINILVIRSFYCCPFLGK